MQEGLLVESLRRLGIDSAHLRDHRRVPTRANIRDRRITSSRNSGFLIRRCHSGRAMRDVVRENLIVVPQFSTRYGFDHQPRNAARDRAAISCATTRLRSHTMCRRLESRGGREL